MSDAVWLTALDPGLRPWMAQCMLDYLTLAKEIDHAE